MSRKNTQRSIEGRMSSLLNLFITSGVRGRGIRKGLTRASTVRMKEQDDFISQALPIVTSEYNLRRRQVCM